MVSFDFGLDPKDEAAAEFVGLVGDKLRHALIDRKRLKGLTQADLAKAINVDRSRVNRCFSGVNNMTLTTVAELAWALGHRITFDLTPEEECVDVRSNYPTATTTTQNVGPNMVAIGNAASSTRSNNILVESSWGM
ncbi:helix-turn-helix domain-containing protein [Ensifer soli]|uniref:helix-turn-helix domain-containing protein n=1 Tax=Ciceribacter sp. sgz301302 TaxID=3342379 RepID=UPI0035BB33A1